MTAKENEIEKIVKLVTQRIESLRAQNDPEPLAPSISNPSGTVSLCGQKIVTIEHIYQVAGNPISCHAIEVDPNSILTPAAKDLVKDHQVQIHRTERSAAQKGPGNRQPTTESGRQLCIVTTLDSLSIDSVPVITRNRLEQLVPEAKARLERGFEVLVISQRPQWIAAQINRNPNACAAVIHDASCIEHLARESVFNCWVADPNSCRGQSLSRLVDRWTGCSSAPKSNQRQRQEQEKSR